MRNPANALPVVADISIIFLGFAAALLLAACTEPAEKNIATDNPDITVDRLFEKDDCRVYRFMDAGHFHYYAVCNGSTTTNSTVLKVCGNKNGCASDESVPTSYVEEAR